MNLQKLFEMQAKYWSGRIMSDKERFDVTSYRKKANKKKVKKSNHKHEYELVEIESLAIKNWFTHIEVCKICGKERNQLRIEK